jgi:hypothetical protein
MATCDSSELHDVIIETAVQAFASQVWETP